MASEDFENQTGLIVATPGRTGTTAQRSDVTKAQREAIEAKAKSSISKQRQKEAAATALKPKGHQRNKNTVPDYDNDDCVNGASDDKNDAPSQQVGARSNVAQKEAERPGSDKQPDEEEAQPKEDVPRRQSQKSWIQVSRSVNDKDALAQTLAETEGFWGEVNPSKKSELNTAGDATEMIREQHGNQR